MSKQIKLAVPRFARALLPCMKRAACCRLNTTPYRLAPQGQYFKRCLGLQRVQHNIEILEVSYNSTTGFGAYRLAPEAHVMVPNLEQALRHPNTKKARVLRVFTAGAYSPDSPTPSLRTLRPKETQTRRATDPRSSKTNLLHNIMAVSCLLP